MIKAIAVLNFYIKFIIRTLHFLRETIWYALDEWKVCQELIVDKCSKICEVLK